LGLKLVEKMKTVSRTGLQWNGAWHDREELLARSTISFPNDDERSKAINGDVLTFLKEWFDNNSQISLRTSGTTGKPKSMMVEKRYMIQSALMTGEFFNLQKGDAALLCLSPEFIAGKMMVVRAIVLGLDLITIPLETALHPAQGRNISFAAMVPLQVAQLMKTNLQGMQRIATLIIGGSAISTTLENALQAVDTRCWHTYAMTETVSHVAIRSINGPNRSDWFTPMQGVSVSLNHRGCLRIDAPQVAALPVETNDLAIISDGKFRILGRIDDMVISAGHKIFLPEIEQKLEHTLTMPFFLVPENHDEAGQIVVLYIENQLSEDRLQPLIDKASREIPTYAKPRKIVQIPKFQYLGSGKIDKLGTQQMQSGK